MEVPRRQYLGVVCTPSSDSPLTVTAPYLCKVAGTYFAQGKNDQGRRPHNTRYSDLGSTLSIPYQTDDMKIKQLVSLLLLPLHHPGYSVTVPLEKKQCRETKALVLYGL